MNFLAGGFTEYFSDKDDGGGGGLDFYSIKEESRVNLKPNNQICCH